MSVSHDLKKPTQMSPWKNTKFGKKIEHFATIIENQQTVNFMVVRLFQGNEDILNLKKKYSIVKFFLKPKVF